MSSNPTETLTSTESAKVEFVPAMNFEAWFKDQNSTIPAKSVAAVLALSGEGATVPFIARYRKEQTGNLDEVGIRAVIDGKERFDQIVHRQKFILDEIERQKKLTPELRAQIVKTFDADRLEDLYLPYKQKRKTKATIAKEAGLEPLADWLWNIGHGTEQPQEGQTLELWAFTFRNEEKEIKDAQAALDGAQDILIERLAETLALREKVRTTTFEKGFVATKKTDKAKPNGKFTQYFEYNEQIPSLIQPQNSHRYLALRRGWMEEELSLSLGGKPGDDSFEKDLLQAFEHVACTKPDSIAAPILMKAARLAYKAHVTPSIEAEVHKALKAVADEVAIKVFSENVRKLLLASPFGPKAVLGVDPGVRTGCKLAVIDQTGKYIASTVMHLQTEDGKRNAAKILGEVLKNADIQAIAVGNGTAGRETEIFVRGVVKDLEMTVPVVMVSEAGASVYSASDVAREEFPDLDVTVRGAISIARRLQDPLAELVKIDPKSIGVGQYQHDVSQPALKRGLEGVVESCVNSVGVNLNTASYHLLAQVSGIGPSLAKAIVEHRATQGLFKTRDALLEVARFSKKTFEQAAGFLRIPESENPLDNTGVHPERYAAIEGAAKRKGVDVKSFLGSGASELSKDAEFKTEVGEFTMKDVVDELKKPGRDPREAFVPFEFRADISEVKDLQVDMVCPGIVTNVTNFGAFVDIGVHQDGLVHLSQLSHKFVKDPREVASPGDRVTVKVLGVDLAKNQISLSIKAASEAPAPRGGKGRDRGERRDRKPEASLPPADMKAGLPASARPQLGAPKKAPEPQRRPSAPGAGGAGGVKKPAPQSPFNNPFASLAGLKGDLKRS